MRKPELRAVSDAARMVDSARDLDVLISAVGDLLAAEGEHSAAAKLRQTDVFSLLPPNADTVREALERTIEEQRRAHRRAILPVVDATLSLDTVQDFDHLLSAVADMLAALGEIAASAQLRTTDVVSRLQDQTDNARQTTHETELEEAAETARKEALAGATSRLEELRDQVSKAINAAASDLSADG